MATYDVHVYKDAGRWHFDILQLAEGSAGASSVVFRSRAENRHGYDTEQEAKAAGLAYKAKLPSR